MIDAGHTRTTAVTAIAALEISMVAPCRLFSTTSMNSRLSSPTSEGGFTAGQSGLIAEFVE